MRSGTPASGATGAWFYMRAGFDAAGDSLLVLDPLAVAD
jgi:hypothetical protein